MIQYFYTMIYIMLGFLKSGSGIDDLDQNATLTSADSWKTELDSMTAKIDDVHFLNPVFVDDWADPTVWKQNDSLYFSFSTTGFQNLKAIQSKDLIHWERCKKTLINPGYGTYLEAIGKNLRSPQVTTINGQRLMYLSCYNTIRDASIVVMTENPAMPGNFRFKNCLVKGLELGISDCIHPFAAVDVDGKTWLFFGSSNGIYRVELSADGVNIANGSFPVRVAGIDAAFDQMRDKVFEASNLFFHNGYWYLFVSAGYANDSSYRLMVGRSKTLNGDFVDKNNKSMNLGSATFLMGNENEDYFYGPGSNGEILTMSDGKTYMFYQCHNRLAQTNGNEASHPLMLQEIFWDEQGWPYFKESKPQWIESCPLL